MIQHWLDTQYSVFVIAAFAPDVVICVHLLSLSRADSLFSTHTHRHACGIIGHSLLTPSWYGIDIDYSTIRYSTVSMLFGNMVTTATTAAAAAAT